MNCDAAIVASRAFLENKLIGLEFNQINGNQRCPCGSLNQEKPTKIRKTPTGIPYMLCIFLLVVD
jgi:hypothetical protein